MFRCVLTGESQWWHWIDDIWHRSIASCKKLVRKKRSFCLSWPLELKPSTWGQFLDTTSKEQFKSYRLNQKSLSHDVKFALCWPLVTLILTWAKKMIEIVSKALVQSFRTPPAAFSSYFFFETIRVVIYPPPPHTHIHRGEVGSESHPDAG